MEDCASDDKCLKVNFDLRRRREGVRGDDCTNACEEDIKECYRCWWDSRIVGGPFGVAPGSILGKGTMISPNQGLSCSAGRKVRVIQETRKARCFPAWRKNDASERDGLDLMSFMQALYYFYALSYLLVPSTELSAILVQAAFEETCHKRTAHLQQVRDWHWCNTSCRVWDPSPHLTLTYPAC